MPARAFKSKEIKGDDLQSSKFSLRSITCTGSSGILSAHIPQNGFSTPFYRNKYKDKRFQENSTSEFLFTAQGNPHPLVYLTLF